MTNTTRKNSARMKAFTPNMPTIMAMIGSMMLGVSPILVRLTDVGPNVTGCYRLLFAIPFLYIWVKLEERANPASHVAPTGREWAMLIFAGFFFTLDLATWHLSIDMTSIVNAAIFNNLTPIFVPIFIWVFYAIKPTRLYITAAILAIIGSAILSGSTITVDTDNMQGDLLAIFSAVAYSGYIIIVKQLRERLNAALVVFWTSFANLCFLTLVAIAMHESFVLATWNDWIGVLGLAILVHIFGQGLLAYSMRHLSAAFVSVTLLLGPVVSSFFGWLLYGESLVVFQYLGGILVLSSIVAASVDDRRSRTKMIEEGHVKET